MSFPFALSKPHSYFQAMCGTFSRTITVAEIVEAFQVQHVEEELLPSYNIKPASQVLGLVVREGVRRLEAFHWWLVPPWARNDVTFRINDKGMRTVRWSGRPKTHFNSRVDTITDSSRRYWRGLLSRRRCAIIGDGFVEWPDDEMRPKEQPKLPHYFYLEPRRPFAFAGLYEEIPDDQGGVFASCNIVTVGPNALLERLPHHRMPAILRPEALDDWLNPSLTDGEKAAACLKSVPEEEMGCHVLGKGVNYGKNDYPGLLEPLSEAPGQGSMELG